MPIRIFLQTIGHLAIWGAALFAIFSGSAWFMAPAFICGGALFLIEIQLAEIEIIGLKNRFKEHGL